MFKLHKLILLIVLFILTSCKSNDLSAREKSIINGTILDINGLKLEIKSMDFRKEVKPLYPLGYYPHYKEVDGYYYHLVYGTLINKTEKKVNIDNIKVKGLTENDVYQAKLVLINEIKSYFWNEIEAGRELDFYFFSLIKKGEKPVKYEFYYDEDGKIDKGQKKFDKVIEYNLPDKLEINKNN